MRIYAFIVALVVYTSGTAWAKKPLPSKPKLEAAKIVARDRYFTDLKQAGETKLKTFLDAGDATSDDDARQAALYFVVADAAVQSGQWSLAFDAVERLARNFDYDLLAGKIKLLESAAKSARSAEARVSLVNRLLELVDEAMTAERFDIAEQASKLGELAAVKLRDPKLRKELAAKKAQVEVRRRRRRAEADALSKAEALLKNDRNDPEANRIVGVHLATSDQWPEALGHFRRADDRALIQAAEADAGEPDEPAKQVVVADAWWELADSFDGEAQRSALRGRAVYWYSRAVGGLKGMPRTRAARRIKYSGESVVVAAAANGGGNGADILLADGVRLRLLKIPGSEDERIKPFWLADTEITEPQWVAVMGGVALSHDLPKVSITFNQCRDWCEKLNATPIGRRYRFRLPSRDEFAHACGKPAAYEGDLAEYAWCRDNSPEKIQPVGQKKANPFGLFDILGNVWELTDDGKFYGMSVSDPIVNPGMAFTGVDLPSEYNGPRADYAGGNVGVRIAADLR
jgi:hypothetical protein